MVCKQWNYLVTPFYFEDLCFTWKNLHLEVHKSNSSNENPFCHSELVEVLSNPDIGMLRDIRFLVYSSFYFSTSDIESDDDDDDVDNEDRLTFGRNYYTSIQPRTSF